MAAKTKNPRPCSRCGNQTRTPKRNREAVLCTDCGVSDQIDSARQMRDKAGPAWDRWLASRGPAGRPRTRTEE